MEGLEVIYHALKDATFYAVREPKTNTVTIWFNLSSGKQASLHGIRYEDFDWNLTDYSTGIKGGTK